MNHSFSVRFFKEWCMKNKSVTQKNIQMSSTLHSMQKNQRRSYLSNNSNNNNGNGNGGNRKKILLKNLLAMKPRNEKISMITAYDYNQAMLADSANVDCVLVGDSCANVMMGLQNTNQISMDQIVHHCQSVSRGINRAYLVADMPFGTYLTKDEALKNAGRLIAEGGASCVKLEGFMPDIIACIARFMPVCGHLGLLPQTHDCFGTRGRTYNDILELADQALALQESGCSFLVLEKVCAETAHYISSLLDIPTIGIGSGAYCDGQVLVWHDMMGLQPPSSTNGTRSSTYKFVKKYCDLAPSMINGICEYVGDVKSGAFPSTEHSYYISDKTRAKLAENQQLWQKNQRIIDRFQNNPQLMFDEIKEGSMYYAKNQNQNQDGKHLFDYESGMDADPKNIKRFRQLLPSQKPEQFTKVITSVQELRQERESVIAKNANTGSVDIIFIPFLGGLHAGHRSLIEKAKEMQATLGGSTSSQIWCSLFLNPTQFNNEQDLLTYPYNMEKDIQILSEMGVDVIFTPNAAEIYPSNHKRPQRNVSSVSVSASASADDVLQGGQSQRHSDDNDDEISCFVDFDNLQSSEGRQRPGHFKGMATIVTKLLALIQPKKMIVGQKNFMQCVLIQKICAELFFNDIKIVIHETVRDMNDGLALSSRNEKLSVDEREKAPLLYQCLSMMGSSLYHLLCDKHQCIKDGILVSDVLQIGLDFEAENSEDLQLKYLAIHDRNTGRELDGHELLFVDTQTYVISIAGRVIQSQTRLIDNIVIGEGFWHSFKHYTTLSSKI